MQQIELLSPARNLTCGLAAINHGADAVYIGASQFSARVSAGNPISDIEKLADYAHQFRSKVYVTLNTILTDEQLPDAEKLIWDIYEAGADALIIQDMGILKLNLPPIALHASTQTDNRTAEKVKFLKDTGFSRVVLARELSLKEIEEIHTKVNVELEAFVHGALCVSYSGQCYISEASCGRSANRGACAQFCRLPYDLIDSNGKVLIKNKHLLSQKDLNLSDYLPDMIKAGISSFKIEGRLKGPDYVKNITAYYRKKLDLLLERDNNLSKLSEGKTYFFFNPNPTKSFNRGSSNYFFKERVQGLIQPDTPKSLGEKVGKLKYAGQNHIEISGETAIHNGDGLCFINDSGELTGFRVNRVDNDKIYPLDTPKINTNTVIYRNFDSGFDKILQGNTAERKITVDIDFSETNNGFCIRVTDEEGISINFAFAHTKEIAQKPETVKDNLKKQLSKLGNTIYEVRNININLSQDFFFPNSLLSSCRREAFEILDRKRKELYKRPVASKINRGIFPQETVDYTANITNSLSEKFYLESGVKQIKPGFEINAPEGVPLMYCRYCIKYELGWCSKLNKNTTFKEPLFLKNNYNTYQLSFDCKNCQMKLIKA